MTDRIPAQIIETVDPSQPIRLTPAQSGAPIHTRSFSGRFRNLRLLGGALLMLLYFGTVWLNWNGRQAVLWDLDRQQFHIFGATFWPQDFILLSAILIIAAFGLFFITVLAGRIWCGYACPQSTWTWMFMWVEKVTEGDRLQRIKLDTAPWSPAKLLRRAAKHTLWLAISLATALAFVGYFTPVRELVADLARFELGATTGFWLLFFTAATYINAGWLREQVCLHMCPYSRFQSVMFDADTLLVSYDTARGENRGARRKGSDPRAQGLGDCVDCTLCVQVCPTGIDIRDGLQYECITCAACVDACDQVMARIGRPRGLIDYTTENTLNGRRSRVLRPRLIGYGLVMVLMMGWFAAGLVQRVPLQVDVLRDRNQLYRLTADGRIENSYRLEILNKDQQAHDYRLSLDAPEGLTLVQGNPTFTLAGGEHRSLPVTVSGDPYAGEVRSATVRFRVRSSEPRSTMETTHEARFIAP